MRGRFSMLSDGYEVHHEAKPLDESVSSAGNIIDEVGDYYVIGEDFSQHTISAKLGLLFGARLKFIVNYYICRCINLIL